MKRKGEGNLEWVVGKGCVKILIVTHDQLLEERPEKICMFLHIQIFIYVMKKSSVNIERKKRSLQYLVTGLLLVARPCFLLLDISSFTEHQYQTRSSDTRMK